MRRIMPVLLSTAVAGALLPAGTAVADPGVIVLQTSMLDVSQSGALRYLQVRAASPAGVAKVHIGLRASGADRPYGSVDDMRRFRGTDANGEWQPAGTVTVRPGRTYLDVEVTDRDGDTAVKRDAAFVDLPGDRLTVTSFGPDGSLDGPFHARLTVGHSRPVDRVEARLVKAATDVAVADFGRLGATGGTGGVTSYRSLRPVDVPVGDYEIVATVWDDRGDRVERRSQPFGRRLPVAFADLRQDRTVVDADHTGVAVTGRLTDPATGGPLPGVTVRDADHTGVATRTGADGRFALTLDARDRVQLPIVAEGHGAYAGKSAHVEVVHRALATRLSAAASPVTRVGRQITLSGKLERQDAAGAWRVLAGQDVTLRLGEAAVTARTGADGRYSARTAVPASGAWEATFAGNRDFKPVRTLTGAVHVQYTAGFQDFGATSAKGGVTARGRLLRTLVTGAKAPVANRPVTLQFSADGRTWTRAKDGRTDAQGRFAVSAAAPRTGSWRVFYDGIDSGVSDTPDTLAYSPVVRGTAFTRFGAAPEPVRKGRTITVSGRLGPVAAGTAVQIYFKADHSTKWTLLATAETGAKGLFSKGFKASKDGSWKAVHTGGGLYLGSSSTTDHVDVR
ncbi:peptidase associated/transthyretin-like domain-containing protein [Actinomadura macrotermitis]|uniref:Carboxypeptidase regulatory-like domain-containing protein n=1 Tax=Actinomadura macrotermitis TaxID=2585200 RepID=A0A7K0BVR1_9ACTN|nr:hypothetical protein [Actinomadura macrotermitis]MQY05247.1 hypothetical protein [Actinomadura macrotermitis]